VRDSHWYEWHRPYDDPDSPLSRRLVIVQQRIRDVLGHRGARLTRVISMCAGQGRDLVPVLADYDHASHVVARLVEADPANVEVARRCANDARLENIEVVCGDASAVDAYSGIAPADLLLVCGVFGNISDQDIGHTIACLPQLCAENATVIWTRHRREPDFTPTIRRWFAENDFSELTFDAPDGFVFGVGTQRFDGVPQPAEPGTRLFEFVGDGILPA
jgi:hypothetical protein